MARERSKGASKFEADDALLPEELADPSWETEFRGYPEDDFVRLEGAKALGLFSLAGGAPGAGRTRCRREARGCSSPTAPSSTPRGAARSTDTRLRRLAGRPGDRDLGAEVGERARSSSTT